MNASIIRGITLLALSISVPAKAQAPFGSEKRAHEPIPADSLLVGARLGLANVDNLSGLAVSYGAFGDWALADNFLVGGTLDYWSHSSGSLGYDVVEVSDLSIGANTKFIFTNVRTPLRPFIAGGLALHRLAVNVSEERSSDSADVERWRDVDSDVSGELGVDLGGGALYRIQENMDVAGELRFRKLTDAKVDLDHLTVTGALAYNL